jgi:transposase-like protein
MSGTPLRRRDYARLDQVGIDVIEAALSKAGASTQAIADRYSVSEFNLRMWRRFRRTELFLHEYGPEDLLDDIANGDTVASIARKHDISHGLLAKWAAVHVNAEDLAVARDNAADAQFDASKVELDGAADDVAVRRAVEKHKIDRFVAERTTRRFTDEKQLRVTGTEGVEFHISYKMKDRPKEESNPPEEREPA